MCCMCRFKAQGEFCVAHQREKAVYAYSAMLLHTQRLDTISTSWAVTGVPTSLPCIPYMATWTFWLYAGPRRACLQHKIEPAAANAKDAYCDLIFAKLLAGCEEL